MADYAQALSAKSSAMKGRKAPKQIRSIEIERAANGGFIASHRFNSGTGEYHEPEQHTFGKGEGKKLLAHLSEHFGMKYSDGDND